MGRNTHHGAGAVVRQHVVGDPNRHRFAGERVLHRTAGGHTAFGPVFSHAVLLTDGLQALAEGLNCLALLRRGELIHQRMLGGEHHIADAKHRVGAGGEHLDGLLALRRDGEAQGGATGATNPIGLHGAHTLWPPLELLEIVEQLIGHRRDFQKPLAQLSLFNQGSRSPRTTVGVHLFVGEHRLVNGVPVDGGFFAVSQIGVEKLQKQPLGPAVVVAVAGRHFTRPVDR